MPLSATQIKNVKPEEKPIKLSDGGGLYLFVKPAGSKLWRMNYRHHSPRTSTIEVASLVPAG